MPGSDQKINYQVRPAKSIERKMLCDLIREIQLIRVDGEMRYIGLGAKYFTDFLLFHNEFGITDMISIEAEKERQIRYDFNKPLKCIQMWYGTTNEVLPQIDGFNEKMNLIWLDYDDTFEDTMLIDVETICRNLDIGSMFFLSCNYSFRGEKPSEKMVSFKNSVGDYFDEKIEKNEYKSKNMPFIIKKLIDNQIHKTIKMRNRIDQSLIEYLQLLFLTYKDGAPMMTIGGILVDEVLKGKLKNSGLFGKYLFMSCDEHIFSIDIPKLTNKEIQLILKNIPVTEEEFLKHEQKFYGIGYDEICKFEKIYRYYPYYSEGFFNT
ncbi:hypothetical protein D7X88_03270 [bacterium C-53]|nr:hypothetical protein [Lachnospiraceae bacterium]NBI02255.1 hypothetical protein [Lachnospiraceae bacterium]RKJ11822.1 hypothetical protein D7X88_03270 [bacterium C-53]